MELFSLPAVYDTAFQFRNAVRTVNFIEWCVAKYTDIPVHSMIEFACGTGFYTREFARRGYTTLGLDINDDSCQYARERAADEALPMQIICGDMVDFSLPQPCELAVNLFDSLTYVTDIHLIIRHFANVARMLPVGGLYIVEVGVIDSLSNHNAAENWTEFRRGFSVATTYIRDAAIAPETHTFIERCSFRAEYGEHCACFLLKSNKRALSFEDLTRLIQQSRAFIPVAYYEDFKAESLLRKNSRPWRVVAVLKKRI